MTDTATAQLTTAMCELAELQHGMITHDQADAAGEPELPAALVAAGLAEQITDTVVRLRAGARHPYPRIYAAWLDLRIATPNDRTLEERGIASHSTALVLYDLTPQYSPVLEFTIHDDDWWEAPIADPDAEDIAEEASQETYLHSTPRDVHWCVHNGMPVTMPAQTLWDLADRLDAAQLRQLAAAFVERHHLTWDQLYKDLEHLFKEHAQANEEAKADLEERRNCFDEDWQPWIVPLPSAGWIGDVALDPERPF